MSLRRWILWDSLDLLGFGLMGLNSYVAFSFSRFRSACNNTKVYTSLSTNQTNKLFILIFMHFEFDD